MGYVAMASKGGSTLGAFYEAAPDDEGQFLGAVLSGPGVLGFSHPYQQGDEFRADRKPPVFFPKPAYGRRRGGSPSRPRSIAKGWAFSRDYYPPIRESGQPARTLYSGSRQRLPDLEGPPRWLAYDPVHTCPVNSARSTRSVPSALSSDDQLVETFLARNDLETSEAAFSALVDRHGAMVLSVCQRVLRNPHDAHDAFQATFLVLVRKAASIRRRESVGGWLFGIARRVAVKARLEALRRRHRLEKLGIERRIRMAT